ncbi:hypothetical protein OPW02_04160 [Vibrio europaeus]|uniref:hypothetical protein n=1 Tax=Vibrio europaeus TaxID=300876 RepID=UPI00233F3707|nr:hypothetical protein [Vibrio europaeus]MDC5703758.1 hypothetical protein [Vibrio europaeus]MDC5708288.1 hypothetical protein [Vibrio europaeus]MDC5714305.1 hypothetical protein [Vibrio europaeus]
MIIKQTRKDLVTNHNNIIFQSIADLKHGDLSKAIGRADEHGNAVFLSDGAGGGGTKFQALHDNGMQIHLARGSSGNWYITDLIDDISDVEMYESVNLNEQALNESINYLPEDGFLVHLAESNDSDNYIPLVFTTNALDHEFTIGHISGDKFTLNDGLPYFDFAVDEVETDDGEIVAYVDNSSLNGRTLLELTNKFKALDTNDEPVVSESHSNQNDMVQQALQFVQRNGI